ncbi:FMN-linked oxidoreductase [Amniculicola lignicola CBS 123094]|uniref:FMN-linked oxidoreductase n=1 Tax=Amniculicola lignicola CBS 123094 TaxID=1392246 RepID=A0A6A5WC11_9PLEO|nr:FMN-linked oxidoreductase [Amniculicola lignicola CBS 123094]
MSPRFPSKPTDPSPLAEPLSFPFSSKTANNRFLKAAMSEALASWHPTDLPARGIPSRELITLYRHWGAPEANIGTVLTGNLMIGYDQLEGPGNMIIPPDAPFSGPRFDAFEELAREATKGGSLLLAQVSHPGRQVSEKVNPNPISASDVQLEGTLMGTTFAKPRAASKSEIADVVEGFAHAAEYLEKAGFDGIEIHGAHGYLLAQFLAQTTNKRTDEYGGSLTNRARIIVEIAHAIKARVSPSFILGIKLNSVEFQSGGFQPEEARDLCKILDENKFDFVELSGGTYQEMGFKYVKESTRERECFFMEFAELIVPALTKTKCYVTGGFRTVGAMIDALETVDGIGLGRPLAQEPRLVKGILDGKKTGIIQSVFGEEFGITLALAATQMKMIANDLEPLDASDESAAAGFQKDLGAFMGLRAVDTEGKLYGWPDVPSVNAVSYGDVSVSA